VSGSTPGESGEYPPRVVFITWNCHLVIEACYAALRARVIRVPLNVRLKPNDWAYMINDVEAEAVVVGEDLLDKFLPMLPELKTVKNFYLLREGDETGLPEGFSDYETAVSEHAVTWPVEARPPRGETEPVEIFYTSGTTGEPKGVIMTPRNLYANSMNMHLFLQPTMDDVFLHALSLFHINGWGALHFITAAGGTQVVMKQFRPEQFCRLVQEHGVTLTCMVPTMLNLIAQYNDLDRFDMSSLRLVVSGGAKLPFAVGMEARKKLGCEILGSYGLTETAPVATTFVQVHTKDEGQETKDDSYFKKLFCPGIEAMECETRVVNDSGRDVEWDGQDVGEILVRGNVVTDGYWRSDAEAEQAFTGGEVQWLHTGDLAVIDTDGYIHIVDRKKDIIIRGGENISSLEIEDVLCRHPSVLEAAVVPAPSEKWGEEPVAVIVTRSNEQVDEKALLEFCRENLATFKVPARVLFVDELPKSGTGKILKRELRGQIG
jgi:fatty-acyl-CoA synthase